MQRPPAYELRCFDPHPAAVRALFAGIRSEGDLVLWAGRSLRWPRDRAQAAFMRQTDRRLLAPAQLARPPRLCFGLYDRNAGDRGPAIPVAYAEFGRIDWRNSNATLSKVLVREGLRGRGLGRCLMEAMLERGFVRLRLHRLDLRVYDFNAIALGLYESLGFRREGLHRDVVRVEDEFWCERSLALLAPEYAAARRV